MSQYASVARPAVSGEVSIKMMWQTVKEYFEDGFVAGSAPLRYNVHLCELQQRQQDKNKNKTDDMKLRPSTGIEDVAMPLFSTLGNTSRPPCSCNEVRRLVDHVDSFIDGLELQLDNDNGGRRHADDYAITSDKGDASVHDVCLYVMRDALCWWAFWGGPFHASHYWKQIYLGIVTVVDDVQVPPQHVVDGTFRFLGHTLNDCLEGLLAEGVPAKMVRFAEMNCWRASICQYLEKIDPGLRPLLLSKTTLMTMFRAITASSIGVGVLILAAEGLVLDDPRQDVALEMSSLGQCLSLDLAKEALGVLQGEKTETVAGNRAQLKSELRWLYARCLDYLNRQSSECLRNFSSASLAFVSLMDRYRERAAGNVRFLAPDALAEILAPFIQQQQQQQQQQPSALSA